MVTKALSEAGGTKLRARSIPHLTQRIAELERALRADHEILARLRERVALEPHVASAELDRAMRDGARLLKSRGAESL